MKYQRCAIQRNNSTLIMWIPQKYVKVDNILSLKLKNSWEDGWKVLRLFDVVKDDIDVFENEYYYIKDTDITKIS